MDTKPWTAEPLEWGHGPTMVEVFHEPTCPFSARAFAKLDQFLADAGEDKITIRLRLHSQPWHMYSGLLIRCIIAASTLSNGKAAAKAVIAAIASRWEEFEFVDHACGVNMDKTPNEIIELVEKHSGVSIKAAFAIPDLDREIKWHCKYSRQNGIHVSPTFMINGLVRTDINSGDPIEDWVKKALEA